MATCKTCRHFYPTKGGQGTCKEHKEDVRTMGKNDWCCFWHGYSSAEVRRWKKQAEQWAQYWKDREGGS